MHDIAQRCELVSNRLDHVLRVDLGLPVADIPAEEWPQVDASPGERFGFLWPRLCDNEIIVAYSSEVIAHQTRWLDDEHLDQYLDMVEALLRDYALDLWRTPERPPARRLQLVEDTLWEERPAAVHWFSEVQLHILDDALEGDIGTQAAA